MEEAAADLQASLEWAIVNRTGRSLRLQAAGFLWWSCGDRFQDACFMWMYTYFRWSKTMSQALLIKYSEIHVRTLDLVQDEDSEYRQAL